MEGLVSMRHDVHNSTRGCDIEVEERGTDSDSQIPSASTESLFLAEDVA